MEGSIVATYALIYRFLKQQAQNKAANAVKKAAKPFVDLRDDMEQNGPPLEDIINAWKSQANARPDTDSSSEDSEDSDEGSSSSASGPHQSEDTSGSESESDDTGHSSDDSDEGTIYKKSPQKPAERDTSVTLSSVGEHARGVANQVAQIPKKLTENVGKVAKDENKSSESDSSSESSTSDSSDAESSSSSSGSSGNSDSSVADEENADEQPAQHRTKATEAKSQSTSESSSESEDETDSESQQEEDTHVAKKRKVTEASATTAVAGYTSTSSSESEGESESEPPQKDTHVAKRRKFLDNEAAVTTAVVTGSQPIARASQKKENPPLKVKERFQRVKIQTVTSELVLDNGYEAKGGAVNDYGERAHHDLIATRGAGFRKEKNKKKRGSYRGGEITMENHSIKFDF